MATSKKNPAETFVESVFGVKCDEVNRHFKSTTDKTVWYKVNKSSNTMYVPGSNVLRVNQLELDRYLGAVEMYLSRPLDDPIFDWEHLHTYDANTPVLINYWLNILETKVKNQVVAADTETKYLFWDDNKLLAIGFALSADTSVAFYNIPESFYPRIEHFLLRDDITFAWHNGKFDKNFLYYTCGIHCRIDEDTQYKHFAQITEQKATHKLKRLGPIYLQAPQWDDELDDYKKKFCRQHKIPLKQFTYDMIPTEILIPYLHRDCIATYRLLQVFDTMKEEGTDNIYHFICRAANVFSQLELNGALVDVDYLKVLEKELSEERDEADALVAAAVSKFWNPAKYSADTGAKFIEEFNINSPKQLKWLLSEATGTTVESSDRETVERLGEMVESGLLVVSDEAKRLFEGILKSRKASKYLDTYVYGMLKAKCVDGRVRSTYNLHGTETGRLSSNNPNMQNCPRNKRIKKIFIAEPGYKLVQLDYSQAELRVLGVLSGDDFLIQSYVDGKDLHGNVAQKIFGENYTSEQRTQCKTINFGIAYGRGPGAIATAFHMSKSEAQKLIDDWFKAMPKVKEYIDGKRAEARKGIRQQTMFGRVRHYVRNESNMFHIENEYINTPIQSMASDLTVASLCNIYDWLVKEKLYFPNDIKNSKVRIVITVHDSIVMEVADDPELVERVAKMAQKIMADTPQQMIPNCPLPFKADIEVGYSYGALEEL